MIDSSVLSTNDRIRLVIVDDHELMISGIKRILGFANQFDILGCASNGEGGLELVSFHQPDILLTDISMPVMDGIELVKQVKESFSHINCVMLTAFEDSNHIKKALAVGADGYLSKEIGAKFLIDALIKVHLGERAFSKGVLEFLKGNHTIDESPAVTLTKREQEILNLIASGMKNIEIAEHLHLSYRTVENHRYHISKKLGVNSSAELIRFAVLNETK